MWLAILAFLTKALDLLNPWSKFWANKAEDSEKRTRQADSDMQKEIKNEGQESMDDYFNAKSRKRKR
jgi:hypothetical protein